MIDYIKGIIKNLFNPAISLFALVDNRSKISKKAKINRNVKIVNSQIGKYTYVGGNSTIVGAKIGSFCSIARDVYIGLAGHTLEFVSTSPMFTEVNNGTGHSWIADSRYAYKNEPVVIGNDVWIGNGVKIKRGITIGDGSIIAAGAVVTHNTPPYSIIGGVPAKLIRMRFPDPTISKLEKIKWWEWPEEKIRKNITLFQTSDISKICEIY